MAESLWFQIPQVLDWETQLYAKDLQRISSSFQCAKSHYKNLKSGLKENGTPANQWICQETLYTLLNQLFGPVFGIDFGCFSPLLSSSRLHDVGLEHFVKKHKRIITDQWLSR